MNQVKNKKSYPTLHKAVAPNTLNLLPHKGKMSLIFFSNSARKSYETILTNLIKSRKITVKEAIRLVERLHSGRRMSSISENYLDPNEPRSRAILRAIRQRALEQNKIKPAQYAIVTDLLAAGYSLHDARRVAKIPTKTMPYPKTKAQIKRLIDGGFLRSEFLDTES